MAALRAKETITMKRTLYSIAKSNALRRQKDPTEVWRSVERQTGWTKWTRFGDNDDRLTDLYQYLQHYFNYGEDLFGKLPP